MRQLSYSDAINEALFQLMEDNPKIILLGPGVNSPWYMGQTTKGLYDQFGPNRLIDTPISECCVTGVGLGAAISGFLPIVTHARMDFMYYAFDQICNQIANYTYMFGGAVSVPIVIRGVINRGGEQAAQHSQALQAMFLHVPGLKVVMPSNAYDAKGMLISAVYENNPVIYIDDRWLYDTYSEVPEKMYKVSLSEAKIIRAGNDLTLISSSYLLKESLNATKVLKNENNIDIELIDLRSISPLDKSTLIQSVKKTGKALIVDGTWETGGISSEVISILSTDCFSDLMMPVKRITLPDSPAPSSGFLEKLYYPCSTDIIAIVKTMFHLK